MDPHLLNLLTQHGPQSLTSHCSQTYAVFTVWPLPACPASPPSAAPQYTALVTAATSQSVTHIVCIPIFVSLLMLHLCLNFHPTPKQKNYSLIKAQLK